MEWTSFFQTLLTSLSSIVVALIAAGYFKKHQDKQKNENSKVRLLEQIQKDEVVHLSIRSIRRKYNADRVKIIQFHNGGNFYTESPMQRASITYERCSDGLERLSDKMQNVLVSNYTFYVKSVIAGGVYEYDVKHIDDLATRSLLESFGTQSHCAVPLWDKQQHLVGVLCLDWVFSEIPSEYIRNEEFTEEFKGEVITESVSLISLL
jgi:hypothetical protein